MMTTSTTFLKVIAPVSEKKTRSWNRPELIVLVRSRPEESVLVACKYLGVSMAYPAFVAEPCAPKGCVAGADS